MTHIAFATSVAWPTLTPDDRLAADALGRRGVRVSPAVWSDTAVEWATYDAIIIRSTWDYHRRHAEFAAWIDVLEQTGRPVWNPCPLLRWNGNKRYLADLARRGVPIVPTEWLPAPGSTALRDVLHSRGWNDVVVKPVISATAYGTRRLQSDDADAIDAIPENLGELMVQPFLPEIGTAGEWSLMFFRGAFSHSVRKRPVSGDFRVQSEFGGSAVAERAPRHVIAAAQQVVDAVTEPWLYARVDGVETAEGFLLMELEMLEPLLFLELGANAPERFAEAIVATLGAP